MRDEIGGDVGLQAYLKTAIATLREVKSEVTEDGTKTKLEACLNTLVGLTNIFNTDLKTGRMAELLRNADVALPDDDCMLELSALILNGPPESLAVTARSAELISRGAAWVEQQAASETGHVTAPIAELVQEELALMEFQLHRMLELQQPIAASDESAAPGLGEITEAEVTAYFASGRSEAPMGEVIAFRPVFGGRSRKTALLTLKETSGRQIGVVIQRDNPMHGKPQGVVGEFNVMQALFASGMKVPRPLFLEMDSKHLRAPFTAVETVPGKAAEIDYFRVPNSRRLAEQLAVELAKLHSVNFEAVEQFLPSTVGESTAAAWSEELSKLTDGWAGIKNWPSISLSTAFLWMKRHLNEVDVTSRSLVHGDPTFHNILADGEEMTALLDWEIVHVGHPAEDLGYCRAAVMQILPWQEFIEIYEGAGGRKFSRSTLDYFSLRAIIAIMGSIQKIREYVDSGQVLDIGMADLGASFVPKLTHRLSKVLVDVLKADAN